MRFTRLLILVALGSSLAPIGARAEHCPNPIYVFSRTRIQTTIDDPTTPGGKVGRNVPNAVSSAVGCTVVQDTALGDEDPTTHPLTETDIIYPGSNRLEVRLLNNGNDPTQIESAVLKFAGKTYTLALKAGVDVTGAAAAWLDSQSIEIDPANTFAGNDAVATICLVEGACYTRSYSTIG